MVAPSPDARTALLQRYHQLQERGQNDPDLAFLHQILRPRERRRPGYNDALVRPGSHFAPGLSLAAMLSDRRPPRGDVHTVVVLVDFPDAAFAPEQNAAHFEQLWFSQGANSVRDYYEGVSRGLVRIVGNVVGPLRMPHPLRYYANRASGVGDHAPNARTMARDAAAALVGTSIDLAPFDNDGDGFVDAFVIVHAGRGAEYTAQVGDIHSHKWVLEGGPYGAARSQIYAYLTIPADCRLGVCAHELGHLVFGWPDLYDSDYTSSGVGDWCLMGSGNYNGAEQNPAPPSAWCLAQQGWVDVMQPKDAAAAQRVALGNVRDKDGVIVKLWRSAASNEYFLVENRQRRGRDADLPGAGLLVWHIDEDRTDNTNEKANYKVALLQSDGRHDLERGANRGDAGDPFPGDGGARRRLDAATDPSTNANNRAQTGITIDGISDIADLMEFSLSFADLTTEIGPAA